MKKRVVVTGIGLVSPLGCGNIEIWNKVIQSSCGISPYHQLPPDIPVCIAAQVPSNEWNDIEIFAKLSQKQRSRSTNYALYASDLALKDAEYNAGQLFDTNRCGVAIASGMGTMKDITDSYQLCEKDSYRKLSPYFVSKILLNMAAGEVSIRHKLRGPNHCVTTACAAGAHSIGDAYNFIRLGYADMMVAGGTEAPLDPLSIAGFAKMRALSRSQDPLTASRPFDKDRDGFVIGLPPPLFSLPVSHFPSNPVPISPPTHSPSDLPPGEGAAILVLESLDSAIKRGVRIYGEVAGYGLSGDGNHITAPPDSGDGAMRSMLCALRDANISPSLIGYINAHATSTPLGDRAEVNAIHSVFSDEIWPAEPSELSPVNLHKQIPPAEPIPSQETLYVSSTKGATGHMLGAAGSMEAALTLYSLFTHTIPPTLNLHLPSAATAASGHSSEGDLLIRSSFQHVPQKAIHLPSGHRYRYAMSNSFGFGGTNASLIFKKYS